MSHNGRNTIDRQEAAVAWLRERGYQVDAATEFARGIVLVLPPGRRAPARIAIGLFVEAPPAVIARLADEAAR